MAATQSCGSLGSSGLSEQGPKASPKGGGGVLWPGRHSLVAGVTQRGGSCGRGDTIDIHKYVNCVGGGHKVCRTGDANKEDAEASSDLQSPSPCPGDCQYTDQSSCTSLPFVRRRGPQRVVRRRACVWLGHAQECVMKDTMQRYSSIASRVPHLSSRACGWGMRRTLPTGTRTRSLSRRHRHYR